MATQSKYEIWSIFAFFSSKTNEYLRDIYYVPVYKPQKMCYFIDIPHFFKSQIALSNLINNSIHHL